MENRMIKLYGSNSSIPLKVVPGHFVTSHSHVNYYIDMTTLKSRLSEASDIAQSLSGLYRASTIVDTILCLDGTQMIGTLLAEELTKAGFRSLNAHSTIYVTSPEYDANGQMFFRDNIQPMIRGKNVLTLMASVTTGMAALQALECIEYYGGTSVGISAIFSKLRDIGGVSIRSVFDENVIPDYQSFSPRECPLCKAGVKIDALVNSFGYSKL